MRILSVAVSLLANTAACWRIWNIARLLQSAGHEVHLVQYVRKPTYETLKDNRLDLGGISNSVVMVSRPTVHVHHLRELLKNDYDLIYGNTHLGTFCAMLGRLKGLPLVFDMHGGIVEEFLLTESNAGWKRQPALLFRYALDRLVDLMDLRFSSTIICVSHKMVRYLHEEKGVAMGKMAYVPNGVDLDFFRPGDGGRINLLRRELGLEDKFVCGYVGGTHTWQGVENFVEAARRLDDPELVFLIVGGDGESDERNLVLIPPVPRSRVPAYYSVCDVLVLPRPSHPATEIAAPTKFAEYAAMGKPILTTNVGDAAGLVKRYSCGIVVEDNSASSLVKGILQLKETSESELRLMGGRARALAEEEFDWNKVGAKLEQAVASFVR